MENFFYILFTTLVLATYSVLPKWNIVTSAIDLLNAENSYTHTYIIDHRNSWYESSDDLKKTIKKDNEGKITHSNTFTLEDKDRHNVKFSGNVPFESIESFYADTNSKTVLPLICPRGNYNPFKVNSATTIEELSNTNNDWEINPKFDLKCFYHRSDDGHFFIYYLMNGYNYIYELKSSTIYTAQKYRFEADEMYDFKLRNREPGDTDWNPYHFMALIKHGDELRLIGSKFNFFPGDNPQSIDSYKILIKIKQHTQAYFQVFHFDNNFWYFTYNDISDFVSGYSTNTINGVKFPEYDKISEVTVKNNLKSPFEFTEEVEIIQMDNIFNYRYVYYTIKNKVTNELYHGIYDIKLDKIMFNTDEEVDLFIPYIQAVYTNDQGNYQHSNSMLIITKKSAYRVCPIINSDGTDCVEDCPSGQKILFDVDGNKCVNTNVNCPNGKIMLIPENICVSECNTTFFISDGTNCGLCRDMDNGNKKYKFINGTECLDQIPPEGAKIYNENLSLLVCDSGYILKDNTCITHCFNTCKTCYDYSENENEQKCKTCIDGYYLENNIKHNCKLIIPTTIPIPIITTMPTPMITTIPIPTITTMPTPMITTIPIATITTIAEMPTTIIIPTPTTFLTTALTTIPLPIITTLPATTIANIQTTIIEEKCRYGILINYTDTFSNLTNEEIYNIARENIIREYCKNGSSVIIEGHNGFNFQVSNTLNEIKNLENGNNINAMDLSKCEEILKSHYGIAPDVPLTILKFINENNLDKEKTFQYEVYNPITFEKLNLSLCDNSTVDVYVPYEMGEKIEEIYNDIIEQGYDPLNINDKFYREICTPYTSENGTDVLLDDREEFIYNSLINATICPSGCNYSEYSLDKKYIKCECGTNNTDIVTLDLDNISGENIYNSFLSSLKTTNWKVMICYNLVFNFKIFCHNYGSILTLILFIVYLVFMIYYSIRDISPIKIEVSKILFEEKKSEEKELKEELIDIYGSSPKKILTDKPNFKSVQSSYPPKKKAKEGKKVKIKVLNTEKNNLIPFPKISKRKAPKKNEDFQTRSMAKLRACLPDKDKDKEKKTKNSKIIELKSVDGSPDENMQNVKDEEKSEKKNLDNFELNNLDYDDACKIDNRTCCKIYLSVLMREHIALNTFISTNDYNLFYVKIEKFLILFCVDMTMNGLFFVHETMHRKYTQGENFTFVQKLPQLLFTLIVAHILEVILCFLGMTDTHVYEIKGLPKKERKDGQKIVDILSCVKRKMVGFFSFTFLLFLFFWYFISAFCAVYQNTQKIFLRDAFISFATSLIDPFIIYGFTTLLRCISISKLCKQKCCCRCVFKISDIIPIF